MFVIVNVALFELFGDTSVVIQKEHQIVGFFSSSNLPHVMNSMAEYVHSKTPYLEESPYQTPETDMRLSTWYLSPHQVVTEWLIFSLVFVYIISHGLPRYRGTATVNSSGVFSLFLLSLSTLLVVVIYKVRAWVELKEWFAMLYLFQPCHMLLLGYVVVTFLLWKETRASHDYACAIFHVLFDLQWFTYVAVALPDTQALLERNFFGEFFLFYFEHLLLMVLPIGLAGTWFRHSTPVHPFRRALFSIAWFGIHHIQVMTPLSLVSGVQVNYQTHLPKYALPWFGRAYKVVITGLSFLAVLAFAYGVDPVLKKKRKKSL